MRKYCEDKKNVMFEPEVGMQFSSTEEAFQFYNMYSWVLGFSIRLGDNYTPKTKQRTMQEYLCQRQGNGDETKNSTTRCGCKAMMRVATNDSCKWSVKKFIAEHNHDMVESCGEKKHLASHRQIDRHTKEMIRHLRENNVSLTRVNLVMGSLFGSMDKVPFSKKTLRTVCSNIAKEALVDDVQKTLQSFREKISRDPRFVFTAELDEDNRLNSLMWTSGRSRSLYQHFGDVITFDTTYETNIYKMPFGMFVGVNNHFQSVIFAGVLLTNETAANFKWAFQEFVAMMGGKPPQTMLTDQSLAMTIAIKENLLSTKHRWCKWHILRKAQEALGHVHKLHSTFSDEFNKVVNHMLTPEEFECGWDYLTKKYDLGGNPFMTRAFEVREKWAKPYFNDIFCARMSSTQRSESANHVLKVYVPCKSSINMFVKQYTKLIDDREKADDEAEKNRSQKISKPMFGYPIEKHACKLYTPAVFKLFKAELKKTASYVIVDNSDGLCYEVLHVDSENRESWSRVNFTITIDPHLGLYKCQCRLYEHFGIICCHIMLVQMTL
ncbi:protein FAR1-RELATED SEQUENCE 5-like [Lolium perenne]|uniref:protein FAR1-RELATED SEQUENCE 5-like n=1 Tax=Lolium perenne TaxID=4522 RepID=UPI003A990B73